MKRYTIYGIKIGTPVFGGVTNVAQSRGNNVIVLDTDGDPEPALMALLESRPVFSFDMADVVAGLGLVANTGEILGANIGGITGGVTFYLAQEGPVGWTEGATHMTFAITTGILVPGRVTAQQGQFATLTMEVHPVASTGLDPVTITNNVALPSLTSRGALWTVGPVDIGANRIEGVQSWEAAFNYDVNREGGDGTSFAKFGSIRGKRPVFQGTTRDASAWLAALPANGQALSGAAKFWLRSATKNGTVVADGTASHYSLDVAAGIAMREDVQGSGVADVRFAVQPAHNDSDPTVELEGAAAITSGGGG